MFIYLIIIFILLILLKIFIQPVLDIFYKDLLLLTRNIHLVTSNHYWNVLKTETFCSLYIFLSLRSMLLSAIVLFCFKGLVCTGCIFSILTLQSCLVSLIMSSLVFTMVREEVLSTENTSRKAVAELMERSRMAGNYKIRKENKQGLRRTRKLRQCTN